MDETSTMERVVGIGYDPNTIQILNRVETCEDGDDTEARFSIAHDDTIVIRFRVRRVEQTHAAVELRLRDAGRDGYVSETIRMQVHQ